MTREQEILEELFEKEYLDEHRLSYRWDFSPERIARFLARMEGSKEETTESNNETPTVLTYGSIKNGNAANFVPIPPSEKYGQPDSKGDTLGGLEKLHQELNTSSEEKKCQYCTRGLCKNCLACHNVESCDDSIKPVNRCFEQLFPTPPDAGKINEDLDRLYAPDAWEEELENLQLNEPRPGDEIAKHSKELLRNWLRTKKKEWEDIGYDRHHKEIHDNPVPEYKCIQERIRTTTLDEVEKVVEEYYERMRKGRYAQDCEHGDNHDYIDTCAIWPNMERLLSRIKEMKGK